ncbi:MAG: NAD(P)-binding domain-containing protein [Pseudomonadota bacterium]
MLKGPEAVTVGLAGFGNVGQELARRLSEGAIPEAGLVAVTARHLDRARAAVRIFDPAPKVVPLDELARLCDVVVECATAEALPGDRARGAGRRQDPDRGLGRWPAELPRADRSGARAWRSGARRVGRAARTRHHPQRGRRPHQQRASALAHQAGLDGA